jgi:SpoVK/Ycf46/Vps4 family AAA+-type ATPase
MGCAMKFDLKIEFNNSTSSNLTYALKLAKKFSNYKEAKKENDLNLITLDKNEFAQKYKIFMELWNIIGHWKGSVILLNGDQIDGSILFSFFRIINCANEYEKAIIPEEYCSGTNKNEGWGCRFLTYLGRLNSRSVFYSDYSSQKYWFDIGKFSSENEWEVDKERIIEILKRECEKNNLYICPIFDFENIEKAVNQLPDQICINDNSSWEIIFEESTIGNEISRKPIGIKPKKHGINICFSSHTIAEKEDQEKVKSIPQVTFDEIGGIDEIIETVREIIELPIKRPDIFLKLGIKPHKGIILYGPPGCGKTLIAKAIANDIDAHFISINGPELINKWYGQSEENLRKVFNEAKDLQPSIIYFDEIDSIAQERTNEENARLESRFVNQLLTLMDGVEDYGKVCVIGSTNRIELIDSALLRPGRFDFSIEIKKPTIEGCKKIFAIQTKDMPIEESFDKEEFSNKLVGLTGAEIAFVAREGAYNCLRRSIDLHKAISEELLDNINIADLIVKRNDLENALTSLYKNSNVHK